MKFFSSDIRAKINSFYKLEDKVRVFTSELIQHYYLSKIYQISPDKIFIQYSSSGKPYFYLPNGSKANYNISHSGDYVILAISHADGYNVGIDIEQIDANCNYNELSSIVFSDIEQSVVANHNDFYKLWTKKESLLKAIGCGFSNDFYKNTNLNLLDIECQDNYVIKSWQYGGYFISVCLSKN
ncbi:MAG: 4'-phosphopantetheinyl transferase superfamily protein [Burkholderiales bacterium]|nr:4'-phosphopantetheinyl transferase superfamily protein [Burkholderiales bacterium]